MYNRTVITLFRDLQNGAEIRSEVILPYLVEDYVKAMEAYGWTVTKKENIKIHK